MAHLCALTRKDQGGHVAINNNNMTSLVNAGQSAQMSHSLFLPSLPIPLSPALIGHLASVDVKQHVYLLIATT